jgi:hypothetical protein
MSHLSLTRKGYIIKKHLIDKESLDKIRKELTVSPKVLPCFKEIQKPKPFPIYIESETRLFMPKKYGIKKFGKPSYNHLKDGDSIQIKVDANPLPHQEKAFIQIKHAMKTGGGVLSLPCGWGKCLGRDTPLIRLDGTIVLVQDIRPGDLLMGDDNEPRTVLNTCQGTETLYRIIPKYGKPYIVNESHILSLRVDQTVLSQKQLFDLESYYDISKPIDMPLRDYLKLSDSYQNALQGYHVGIEYPFQNIIYEPYEFGRNLGLHSIDIHTVSDKIPSKLIKLIEESMRFFKIPIEYLINTKQNRLELLAGILDSCGRSNQTVYQIHFNSNRELLEDLIYLIRSLGLGMETKYQDGFFDISIWGYQIPTKYVLNPRDLRKSLLEPLEISKMGIGDYYGFTLDGNGRFLLSDFQVSHNTFLAIKTAAHMGKKTLVVVNKEFLMDQWVESIEKFSNARVGIIQQNKVQVEDRDIVVAMLHSLCMKNYPVSVFDQFGFVAIDECHHIASEMFSRALPKIAAKKMLGLSATPDRKDGLSKVFYHYLGDLFHREKRTGSNLVIVKKFIIDSENPAYETLLLSTGTKNTSGMITNISQFDERNQMLLLILKKLFKQGRKILVLSARRGHLEELQKLLDSTMVNNL